MDFIISKTAMNGYEIIRPVQVKGKYPEAGKTDKVCYGYVGGLNQIHRQMVLAVPFFETAVQGNALFVAYMPWSQIKPNPRGYRCEPATFRSGAPKPRREFQRYIDAAGLAQIERDDWG